MRITTILGIAALIMGVNLQAAGKPVAKAVKKQNNWHSSSSSSSSSDDAYNGAYTENITLNFDFTPPNFTTFIDPETGAIIFDTNQPGSPKNITHPIDDDYTTFGIEKCGTYLITWSFTIGCSAEGACLNGTFVQLYDAATDEALKPNPLQFVDTESLYPLIDSEVVSGQTLVRLQEGTELQLRIIPAVFQLGEIWIANPSITITKVNN